MRTLDTPHNTWKLQVDPTVGSLFRKLNNLDLPAYPVASGSDFIARTDTRKQLRALTQGAAVEMNLEGLAPVCADHRVPLCAIRIISDSADEKAAETFKDFVRGYDGAAGRFVASLIEQLPPTKGDLDAFSNLHRLIQDSPGTDPTQAPP